MIAALDFLGIAFACASAFASLMALRNWRRSYADVEAMRREWFALRAWYCRYQTELLGQRKIIAKAIDKLNAAIDRMGDHGE